MLNLVLDPRQASSVFCQAYKDCFKLRPLIQKVCWFRLLLSMISEGGSIGAINPILYQYLYLHRSVLYHYTVKILRCKHLGIMKNVFTIGFKLLMVLHNELEKTGWILSSQNWVFIYLRYSLYIYDRILQLAFNLNPYAGGSYFCQFQNDAKTLKDD